MNTQPPLPHDNPAPCSTTEMSEWLDSTLTLPPGFEVYFEPEGTYYIKDGNGEWMKVGEKAVVRRLRNFGFDHRTPEEGGISEVDKLLLFIQQNRRIHTAGRVAGRQSGVVPTSAGKMLVLAGPEIIQPKEVSWNYLRHFLQSLLGDENHDQLTYFHGWMKMSYQALVAGDCRPGQILILAGPPDCGKSLLQKVITQLLGGRQAEPYHFMSGRTPFNSDLVGAEHHVIEDEFASSDFRTRRYFASQLKIAATGAGNRIHAKGKDAFTLPSYRRVSISVNEEMENLAVLPPLDDSISDKLIALRCRRFEFPLPTDSAADRTRFWEVLTQELPGYLHFLQTWEIPQEFWSRRFGVSAFIHPHILDALSTLTPEETLRELIYQSGILHSGVTVGPVKTQPGLAVWRGTQTELENILMGNNAITANAARRLFQGNNSCGIYLERLSRVEPTFVRSVREANRREWLIVPDELQHFSTRDIEERIKHDATHAPEGDFAGVAR